VPLTNLVIIDPLPAGTCCARNAYRATIQGAYHPEREAFVWEMPVLDPGASVVGHVLFHSYSSLPHGTTLTNEVVWWADGYIGRGQAEAVAVDCNRCQYPGQAWPTLTPMPTPNPTPALPSPPPAQLLFEPSRLEMQIGTTQPVSLTVQNVRHLSGIHVAVGFDPAIIQIEDAAPALPGTQVCTGTAPYPDWVAQTG
jgi:hypothetical protein